jgi:hypothetical protein
LRIRRALFAALACAAFTGCETAQRVGGDVAYELNPFGATELGVQAVEAHGPYLVAKIAGRRDELRVIAAASSACASLLRPEARLHYAKSGVFGRVEAGDVRCELLGVASLADWRDRQPRRRGGVVPRATARFTQIYQDDRLTMLRGRFPLASRVGIPAGYDLVALVPRDAACDAVAAKQEASLEFRPAGPDPFRMMADDAACVVTGFAIPVSPP